MTGGREPIPLLFFCRYGVYSTVEGYCHRAGRIDSAGTYRRDVYPAYAEQKPPFGVHLRAGGRHGRLALRHCSALFADCGDVFHRKLYCDYQGIGRHLGDHRRHGDFPEKPRCADSP